MDKARGHTWARIDKLRVGRWGEQFVAMALTQRGFDTYMPAVDDRSVDLLVRAQAGSGRFIELQVKTIRLDKSNYVFMRKRHFVVDTNRWLALVVLKDGDAEPSIYLVPSLIWREPKPPFASRDFVGRKSEPEFGLSINRTTLKVLAPYRVTIDKDIDFSAEDVAATDKLS